MQIGSKLRVILALGAAGWIAFAIFAGLWIQPHSEVSAYSEGRGLGAALMGGLVFVGLNAAFTGRSSRKITWRTRFPAAWLGAVLGIAFGRRTAPGPTFPPEFDFSEAIAMDGNAPTMYFDSPFGAGGLGVAVFLQLGMFLIAASQHSYTVARPWRFAAVEHWHWGKLALLWVGAAIGFLATNTIAWEVRGSVWAPFWWFIFALYVGAVAVTTWRWLSAREKQ